MANQIRKGCGFLFLISNELILICNSEWKKINELTRRKLSISTNEAHTNTIYIRSMLRSNKQNLLENDLQFITLKLITANFHKMSQNSLRTIFKIKFFSGCFSVATKRLCMSFCLRTS